MSQITRRAMVSGVVGAAALAFDPVRRTWVTDAQAASGGISVPGLDGSLTVDPAALAEAADDFRHIVPRAPIAVLRSESTEDVRRMVRYASRHHLKVAMRGQGHSTQGQAQVQGGIVIDSRTLATIHEIECDRAVVDAGVTWSQLVAATVAEGLTPPVLTDYLELSVGGTLSVGGIGGATHRKGVQIDNVLELVVITGDAKRVVCSRTKKRELFNAVLGGLGQYGIITQATIRLSRRSRARASIASITRTSRPTWRTRSAAPRTSASTTSKARSSPMARGVSGS